MIWLGEIIIFIATMFAFTYGAHVSFKKDGILFLQIATCAFGCFFLGSIYNLLYFFCLGTVNNSFNIGDLASVGGTLFLFSSYYGAMNRIADSSDKSVKRYKIISLVAPLLNIIILIWFIFCLHGNKFYILKVVYMLLLSAVSYFSFKNLILPDIENGILKNVRFYNLLIFILCIVQNLYVISYYYNFEIAVYLKIISSVIILFLMPTANKGVKKWLI